MQDDLEESADRKACQFKRSWLGDCSGLQDPHYGYSQGRPCILLRMNRVRKHVTQHQATGICEKNTCVFAKNTFVNESTQHFTVTLEADGFSDILWPFEGLQNFLEGHFDL